MPSGLSEIARRLREGIRRSLREFIGLPLIVVAAFIALFAATYVLDDVLWNRGGPVPLPWLARNLGDSSAISSLLGTVASGMITVTSITFSLLLIAVQQTASSLSTHVYDQFIQRRSNKFSFGFFVGLSIFVLFTLGSASSAHRPVLGALVSLTLTGIALCMIVILIYSTVDQMRPYTVITAIHDHTIAARRIESDLLRATRRTVGPDLPWSRLLRADRYGVVGAVDYARAEQAIADHAGRDGRRVAVEIVACVGTNIAQRDPFLRVHADRALPDDICADLDRALRATIEIEPRRTLEGDAGFGIEQLYSIAWTTASTAKQNPQPAILVCHCLRDLIARWSHDDPIGERAASRIVYADNAIADACSALTSIGVVSSESMQSTLNAEIWHTIATLLDDIPTERVPLLADSVARLISSLGDHVMTRDTERSLNACEAALRSRDESATADQLREAAQLLSRSIGQLNARGTRVPQPA